MSTQKAPKRNSDRFQTGPKIQTCLDLKNTKFIEVECANCLNINRKPIVVRIEVIVDLIT